MLRGLTNVLYPSRFQGDRQGRNYFEGYYIKLVDAKQGLALALIPGISYDSNGNAHAFIQVLDGERATSSYHKFDIGLFKVSKGVPPKKARNNFSFCIGTNSFSLAGISINLPALKIEASFRQNTAWPWSITSPGAMGPYSFAPFMQCKHGVVSVHHHLSGEVTLDEQAISLDADAVGYIEKDWGRSFPSAWIWMQSNHLQDIPGKNCLMVSVGTVPWLTGEFTGFIACLMIDGNLIRFATYLGGKLNVQLKASLAELIIYQSSYRLEITAYHAPGAPLVSPLPKDGMQGKLSESLQAHAEIVLYKKGTLQLSTTARHMGLEIAGKLETLLAHLT